MAVAGINNVSVLESSYLGENHSPFSRRWGNQERPFTRTSFIRKMWRDLEGESRFGVVERQHTSERENGNMGSQCSCLSEGTDSEIASINTSEAENECPSDQNQMRLQNRLQDNGNLCLQCSPAFDVPDKQRVRQIFRERGSKNSSGRVSNVSHKNNCSRVRTVQQWIESNAQQAETGHSVIQEQAPESSCQIEHVNDGLGVNHIGVGARKSIRRLYGRQALLDLLARFQMEREKEMQSLLENRPVSTFAHRNRIQSLLRGRFLWNQRFVQDEKSSSNAASELGLLRQTHTVSDMRKGFLSRLDSNERIHYGPQSDTSSDNGMKDHQENLQELPDNIVNDFETINTRSNIGGTHKVDCKTESCGSPREYAAPIGERHAPVLDSEGVQHPPPTEIIESRDQDLVQEGSVEGNPGAHHIELSHLTLELESPAQCPQPTPSTILQGEELELDDAFDHLNPSETNSDSLSWQESCVEVEDNDGNEWHRLTNTESNEGLEANSIENEEDEWYQESHDGWIDNALDNNTAESWFGDDNDNRNRPELRELMSRRRVSNLLESDFRLRLDQVLQSYVERQYMASESESDEWMLEMEQQDRDHPSVDGENDDVERTEGDILQTSSGNDWEMINGLRMDMVRLQERMNSMQKTMETCMNMQLELQRSVQQEVSSALNRSCTSGEEDICFLCCDSSDEPSPNRGGHVYVCSNCAEKINWSKLKESIRHP